MYTYIDSKKIKNLVFNSETQENSKNQDIFTNPPSGVEQKQLDELFILVKN
ncbi:hypothetical protein [Mycoplasmopsis felis]|uniref:hypothetical protein n=1 Tax=Mycoplasmopsis felis TaxID=33923 RepID=UPI002AFEC695|nr:hypothetical protein [Mycoplasmopsis felis]WQQ04721.1 hypothetical protein RRG55_00015 [Mycoplasmopsis felis]